MSGRHRHSGSEPDEPDDRDADEDVVELADLQIAPGERGRVAPGPAAAPSSAPVPRGALTTTPLVAEQIGYVRGGRAILESVSVRAEPGQALALTGPSGSGKSSLLALLAGLEQPDSGTVRRDPDARVGLVLQGYGLVAVLTASENVEMPLQAGALGRLGPDQIRRRAAALLGALGLAAVADHLIEELSGGQQQRVAIARALVIEPSVLLADELTAELDHEWKERVVAMALDVAARGGVVVLATHDSGIATLCHARIRLDDGRVAPPDELTSSPARMP